MGGPPAAGSRGPVGPGRGQTRRNRLSENDPKDRVLMAPEGGARSGQAEGDFESDAGGDEQEAAEGPGSPEPGNGAESTAPGEGGTGGFDPFRRRRRRRRRRGRRAGSGGPPAAAPARVDARPEGGG